MSNQHEVVLIPVVVNGEAQQVPAGLNVRNLVEHLGLEPARVAVELNRCLVRKPDWETTPVEPGAVLEIVTFVGGG